MPDHEATYRQLTGGAAQHGRTEGRAGRRKRFGILVLLPMFLFALPGAASADGEAGAGAGTGSETHILTEPQDPEPNPPFCLKVKQSEYQLTAAGTVTANNGAIVYAGADIVIDYATTEDYFISPEGTYGARNADGTCNAATFGPLGSVTVTVSVNAEGDGQSGVGTGANGVAAASRTCTGTGQYFRVNTSVTVTWEANCAVDGNDLLPAMVEPGTDFTFEGNLFPTGHLEGEYVQT